jgi:hypothetical protein
MIEFNDPSRWVILRYRPGTGGKFLCACLMTIDKIAHWDARVEHKEITFQAWVDTQWRQPEQSKWIAYEPLHDWHTTFFSRTFPRGNNISLDEYNRAMNAGASPYLKQLWAGDKLILDFVNKETFPAWWQESYHITLDAEPNCPTHKKFLLSKIYPYNTETKMGTSMMDKPLDENKYQNARVFANPYEFGPFNSEDEWYDYIWKTDFRLNFNLNHSDLLVNDLLDYSQLRAYISKVACDLDSSFDESDLDYLFNYWAVKKKI